MLVIREQSQMTIEDDSEFNIRRIVAERFAQNSRDQVAHAHEVRLKSDLLPSLYPPNPIFTSIFNRDPNQSVK